MAVIEALRELLEGLGNVLEAERSAISTLDLQTLEFLTSEKSELTQALELALVRPELRDDPHRRREVARAVSSIRRQAAVNAILLQDAQVMLSRVRPEPKVSMTYSPRACNVRAQAANDGRELALTGAHD
ncbi:MAG: hypothetical protein ACE37F_02800 [Nannocystaceae bacterium]|nr:flagellar protein FlgN [bacterium]